jgi:pimeloyl-ACP methyl ester carboxylesterase
MPAKRSFLKPMLHYEKQGQGSPVILLHGIGSNSKSFRHQLETLSKRFTTIAWDAPGFGKSQMPATPITGIETYTQSLLNLLDSENLPSATILGHSFGGIIAQDFYRQHPTRTKALILADTTQGGGDPSKRLQMLHTMTPAQLARERAPNLLSRNAPLQIVEEAIARMAEIHPPGYEAAAIAIASADTRGVLEEITIPLLMIWGAEDTITPPWTEWPKKAQVQIIPNAGHLCYLEQPELFDQIVIDFLQPLSER